MKGKISNFIFKSVIVSKFTFIEIIKSKILFNVLLLGLALLIVCYVAYSFTFGVPERVAIDFGLGCLSISSVAIAIFMGVGLLSLEIENRTVYMVLSRPIERSSFLLGRTLGLAAVLILNIIILSVMTIGLYVLLGGKIQQLFYWVILFSILESLIVLLLVVFFSLLTNRTMSVLYTISVYIVGHAINETLVIRFVQHRNWLHWIIKLYTFVFPNFSKLNLKDFVLYKQNLPNSLLFGISVYGILYLLILLMITCFIFQRKNLD